MVFLFLLEVGGGWVVCPVKDGVIVDDDAGAEAELPVLAVVIASFDAFVAEHDEDFGLGRAFLGMCLSR